MTDQERIDGLLRHIHAVQENCSILAEKLMLKGECALARRLLQNAQAHDASKFSGIEWEYLTIGNEAKKSDLKHAVEQHQRSNPHHPEYWSHGLVEMPLVYEYEMIADLTARSNEMGTSVRDFVINEVPKKYNIPKDGELHRELLAILDMLVNKPFEPAHEIQNEAFRV
jgi:hypothetical protein